MAFRNHGRAGRPPPVVAENRHAAEVIELPCEDIVVAVGQESDFDAERVDADEGRIIVWLPFHLADQGAGLVPGRDVLGFVLTRRKAKLSDAVREGHHAGVEGEEATGGAAAGDRIGELQPERTAIHENRIIGQALGGDSRQDIREGYVRVELKAAGCVEIQRNVGVFGAFIEGGESEDALEGLDIVEGDDGALGRNRSGMSGEEAHGRDDGDEGGRVLHDWLGWFTF